MGGLADDAEHAATANGNGAQLKLRHAAFAVVNVASGLIKFTERVVLLILY
jgi:hypothetical protein